MDLVAQLKKLQERPGGGLVVGLGGTAVILFLVAVVGAFALGSEGPDDTSLTAGTFGVTDTSAPGGDTGTQTTDTAPPDPNAQPAPGAPAPGQPAPGGGGGARNAAGGPTAPAPGAPAPAPAPGNTPDTLPS